MFKSLAFAFKRQVSDDPLSGQVSDALKENQAASARFRETMCRLFDGPNCACLHLGPPNVGK